MKWTSLKSAPLNRRSVLMGGQLALASVLVSGSPAWATYPDRAIRIICGSGAGGIVDITARIVADRLTSALGRPVIVENMPGAGSSIAIRAVARAEPDGYTLLLTGAAISVAPALYPKLEVDVVNDLAPISVIGDTPLVMFVHKSVPGNDYQSLVDHLKANPNKVNAGSNGRGTGSYLAIEFFKKLAGVEMTNILYKTTPQVIADLISGRIGLTFTAIGGSIMDNPEVRPVGLTAASRSKAFPNVPTFAEHGVQGFESGTPTMLLAPKGTPENIIEALHNALKVTLSDPATRARLDQAGVVFPIEVGPGYARQFLASEVRKWTEILRDARS